MGEEEGAGAFTGDGQHARLIPIVLAGTSAPCPGDLSARAFGEILPGDFVQEPSSAVFIPARFASTGSTMPLGQLGNLLLAFSG